ncbi:MAG: VOC family protein [Rhodobacteraceae bacterium]|nr:VOC family protein [Paracoccaceae bacterium]
MSFDPYLHFQGDCAAAMEWYADIFGADDLFMMRYSEMPEAPPPMADSNRVMHSTLTLGGRILMASDFPPGEEGDPQKAVSISHMVPDLDHGQRIFNRLREGGHEIMGWSETFFAEGFGMLRDKFGTHWMIMSGPKQMGG